MNASLHLMETLDSMYDDYLSLFKTCRSEFTEEAVHDLRVATRRLLSLIELLGTPFSVPGYKKIRRLLKSRLDGFDPLRDIQVMLLQIARVETALPDLAPFKDFLKKREKHVLRKASKQMKGQSLAPVTKWLGAVRKKLQRMPDEGSLSLELVDAGDSAFAVVLTRYAWMDQARVDSIHRLRIGFKQFRYLMEIITPLIPDYPVQNINAMHNYQDSLGRIQDLEVLLLGLSRFHEGLPAFSSEEIREYYQEQYREVVQDFLKSKERLMTFWRPSPESPFPWTTNNHGDPPRKGKKQ